MPADRTEVAPERFEHGCTNGPPAIAQVAYSNENMLPSRESFQSGRSAGLCRC